LNFEDLTWKELKQTGEVPRSGRHGHTACGYKNNLMVVFGGQTSWNRK